MEKKILGRTGMNVSRLLFGGMEMRNTNQENATKILNTALDMGINYVDTSPEYEYSEEFIGNAISGRRHEYFLATKCGDYLEGNAPNPISSHIYYTKDVIISNVERSLKLLKTDYIDLLQYHGLMPEYLPGGESDELMQLLFDMKKEGKIRYIGATFRNGRKGEEKHPAVYGYECAEYFMDWKVLDTIQIVYGAMMRTNENVIGRLSDKGFGVIARGAMKEYFDEDVRKFNESDISELFEAGESKNSFLLRYALSHPGVAAVVVGTSNVDHLKMNIEAANRGNLSDSVYNEAKKRLEAAGFISKP